MRKKRKNTAQKMKRSIKDFLVNLTKFAAWSHSLKKFLMKKSFFVQ